MQSDRHLSSSVDMLERNLIKSFESNRKNHSKLRVSLLSGEINFRGGKTRVSRLQNRL